MLVGKYQGNNYIAEFQGEKILISSHNPTKRFENFEKKNGKYEKLISLDDENLEDLYNINFYVKYNEKDSDGNAFIKKSRAVKVWYGSENSLVVDISEENDRPNAAYKVINFSDCVYFIEVKKYFKKRGILVNFVERNEISPENCKNAVIEFKLKLMLMQEDTCASSPIV